MFHSLPMSKLLRFRFSGTQGTDLAERVFWALPRSKPLRWPGAWRVHCPGRAVHLNHIPGPAAQFPRCAARASSQVCHVSPLGSWSQAATLLEMSIIQDPRKTWLATGSLLTVWSRMPVSGAETGAAPSVPALTVTYLPLCSGRGRGLNAAS